MSIDYTFYAIAGIKADAIELDEDVIGKLQCEEIGSLIWIDSNSWSGGEEYIGIVLYSQDLHEDQRIKEFSAAEVGDAITNASLELESIGYEGEVKLYLLMAIS
ncbi:MAG: hypothetical protein ACRC62_37010 [Microcoleus sp.]